MDKIKEVLKKFTKDDYQIFHDTIDMLCSKGVGNGAYQDYSVLMDVLSILTIAEALVKKGTENL